METIVLTVNLSPANLRTEDLVYKLKLMFSRGTKCWDFRESLSWSIQELSPLRGDSQWWAVLRLPPGWWAEDMNQVTTLQLLQTRLYFSEILIGNQKLPGKMEEENCDNSIYLWTSWCCTYDSGIMSWAGDLESACVFFCHALLLLLFFPAQLLCFWVLFQK